MLSEILLDEPHLLDLLRDTLGSSVETSRCVLIKERPAYRVWQVDTRRPTLRLVIKLAGAGAQYSSPFERTAAVHRLVSAQTSIPMPEVLLADHSRRKWPWQVFIKTYIPGRELAEIRKGLRAAEARAVQAQIADATAQIHAIHPAGFGALDACGQVETPHPAAQALEAHARAIIPGQSGLELFLAALEARQHLFDETQPPSLCHEDLHAHNLIFAYTNDGWRLATVLDFEKAWSGPRESDLARMDLWRMTAAPFWQVYTARLPVDTGYAERRALLQLLWCLEVAWDTKEHQATTRELMHELGMKG